MSEDRALFSYGGVDGGPRVEVTVSDDAMTAWGMFYAGTVGGKLLVWAELHEVLQNAKLGAHLLEREIQEVMFRFNTSHPAPENVVIARGTAPQAERPAYLRLEPRIYNHHFHPREGAQIDQKEYSPFVIVKKGELLARGVPSRPGTPGSNVYGDETAPGKKDIKLFKPGPHTLFAHGKVFARIAGRFTLEGDVFDVSDTLELDEVGYSTGNLVFPGTLIIKGAIAEGFKIAAGQGITVKGTLDASEVLCHGDLGVDGGIIGRHPGLVRSGGTVRCLYVEHCQVESLGTITVGKALLHATVFTNADLRVDAGRAVASTLSVKGTLVAGQLGGENGAVKVVSGLDFVVQRKLDALRQKHVALEEEIRLEKEPTMEKMEAMTAIVEEINALTSQLYHAESEVRVLGNILEGTVIEMGHASLTVTKPLKAQMFRLSSDGKTVQVLPIVAKAN
jgi:uncharacterized protein (DUF342 family)